MPTRTSIADFGFVHLDRRRKVPLFRQIYDSIRTAILDGQLKANSRITSSRELADQLGVSRTTIVAAIDRLIAEGYLQSVSGSGTFVSCELPDENPFVDSSSVARNPTATASVVAPANYLSESGKQYQNLTFMPTHLNTYRPFRPGVPALDEFPVKVWSQIVRRKWRTIASSNLSYGEPAGYFPLRESIADYLRSHRGVRCTPDQVILVNGTQQAFDIIARLCLDPGDEMLIENPGYTSARKVFTTYGATVVPMQVDEDGAMVDSAIAKYPQARMAYVTPSHQYPMGVTLPIERRMALIQWAGETGGLIIEDDYDSEYRYSQTPIPAMQGLDSSQRTIYVGSFSKVIFPALSLGYVIVPPSLIRAFENALPLISRPACEVDQIVLNAFMREGHFGRHLRRMRKTHALRRQTFIDEVEKRIPSRYTIRGSQAGLHCAAILNDNQSDVEAARQLEDIGIIARPLSHYYLPGTPKSKKTNGLVFGFACSTPKQIVSAVKKMASL